MGSGTWVGMGSGAWGEMGIGPGGGGDYPLCMGCSLRFGDCFSQVG
jgi:hypothetical protein